MSHENLDERVALVSRICDIYLVGFASLLFTRINYLLTFLVDCLCLPLFVFTGI